MNRTASLVTSCLFAFFVFCVVFFGHAGYDAMDKRSNFLKAYWQSRVQPPRLYETRQTGNLKTYDVTFHYSNHPGFSSSYVEHYWLSFTTDGAEVVNPAALPRICETLSGISKLDPKEDRHSVEWMTRYVEHYANKTVQFLARPIMLQATDKVTKPCPWLSQDSDSGELLINGKPLLVLESLDFER